MINWKKLISAVAESLSDPKLDLIERKYKNINYDLLDRYITKLYKSNSFAEQHLIDHSIFVEIFIDQLHKSDLMYLWKDVENRLEELIDLPSAVYVYKEFDRKITEIVETLAEEEKRGRI